MAVASRLERNARVLARARELMAQVHLDGDGNRLARRLNRNARVA